MTEREHTSHHEAGRAVMAYLRNVHLERVTILADERRVSGTGTRSYADSVRMEIGLAGAFAQCLHAGGFTPGRQAPKTYIRAMNACLKCSEDDAAQRALAREVKHEGAYFGSKANG